MKKNIMFRLVAIAAMCICAGATFSFQNLIADSPSVIKRRMKSRLAKIVKLKTQGIVGENNKGYLELIKKTLTQYTKIIEAENSDRKQIYRIIAKAQSVDIGIVEKQRAKQIRKKAPAGVWLQDENGKWYKK